ncbi:hypothetical protein DYB32_009460 [Aphanomyces invadans]|uniref:Condensation domain-containing protein n=1 Tax=Aphanomyces invadans TaxID=157072 RepID=A0A3R6ZIG8_9STRA|nr:hypothetical protein DYB32_009460 [Aphanomyces invadans]
MDNAANDLRDGECARRVSDADDDAPADGGGRRGEAELGVPVGGAAERRTAVDVCDDGARGIFQVIREDAADVEVAEVRVSSLDAFLAQDYVRGFAVGDKFFVRLALVEAEDGSFAVLTIHHALYDGWSLSMLMGDLMNAYSGVAVPSRPSFCNVVDYIKAQDAAATEAYWQSYLSGAVPSPIGSLVDLSPEAGEARPLSTVCKVSMADLTKAAQRCGVTVADLTKLAWAAALRKYTRQDDVVFGEVLANRDIAVKDADKIMGPLISTVPCRVRFDDASTLSSQLKCVLTDRVATVEHSHASLTDVKRWSGIEGDLFDTLLVYQNLPGTKDNALATDCEEVREEHGGASIHGVRV